MKNRHRPRSDTTEEMSGEQRGDKMQNKSDGSKARVAIVHALQRLVLERPFEKISVGTIVAAADVGRSTFYEHFSCKEDVLRVSLTPLITVLSETITSGEVSDQLIGMLEHLHDQADLVQAYLRGSLSPLVVDCLTVEIDRRLAGYSNLESAGIPRKLLAAQLAETIFGVIRSWVSNHSEVSSTAIATHLLTTAESILSSNTSSQRELESLRKMLHPDA